MSAETSPNVIPTANQMFAAYEARLAAAPTVEAIFEEHEAAERGIAGQEAATLQLSVAAEIEAATDAGAMWAVNTLEPAEPVTVESAVEPPETAYPLAPDPARVGLAGAYDRARQRMSQRESKPPFHVRLENSLAAS